MEDRPAYVPLSSIPATEPDPSRIGVVRNEPGQPFEHVWTVPGRKSMQRSSADGRVRSCVRPV